MAGLTIEFTNAATQRRRYRFVPRGEKLGWWRIEEEYSDGEWRPVGKEIVTDVAIEADTDICEAVAGEPERRGSGTVVGP